MAKVLLVEDDSLIVNIYTTFLKNLGHKVSSVGDGTKALEVALDFKPQVILLDLMVPKLGGAQILAQLRAKDIFKKIPIIVYTNLASEEQKEEMLKKGATEFLSKSSTNPKDVAALIQKYLQS